MITQNEKVYTPISSSISKSKLKELLLNNPYSIYAVVDESFEGDVDRSLTTFLVLFASEFEDNIMLYDISSQIHSTLKIDIDFVLDKKIESIDIGLVEYYPIQLYQEKKNEVI